MLALYATPTPQKLLNATAATSPAHRVPCLLSPLSCGIGSESLPLMSYEAAGSFSFRVWCFEFWTEDKPGEGKYHYLVCGNFWRIVVSFLLYNSNEMQRSSWRAARMIFVVRSLTNSPCNSLIDNLSPRTRISRTNTSLLQHSPAVLPNHSAWWKQNDANQYIVMKLQWLRRDSGGHRMVVWKSHHLIYS